MARNSGWVKVGTDHDTAAFAVARIRRWWDSMGRANDPRAERLLITADGGGSHGSRVRPWKAELQRLADETELEIAVCHFPPGKSQWNKIEHRLFSFIGLQALSMPVPPGFYPAGRCPTGRHSSRRRSTPGASESAVSRRDLLEE